MAEIELKYLISEGNDNYSTNNVKPLFSSIESLVEEAVKDGDFIRQGYVPLEEGKKIAKVLGMEYDFVLNEARLRQKGSHYFYTLKGEGGFSRNEMEQEIDPKVFFKCWPLTSGKRISKFRLERFYQGLVAEIDVFTDRDMILAEIELPSKDYAKKIKPLGKDVTEDKKYKNKNMAK